MVADTTRLGQSAPIEDSNTSAFLAAAGAVWCSDTSAGNWIASRLGPFGATVGHAVPNGYAAQAVMPLEDAEDPRDADRRGGLASLLDVLAPFTGSQPVYCGVWHGFGWLYDPGEDLSRRVGVAWSGVDRPSPAAIEQARAEGAERLARTDVERPAQAPLELPHRSYHLWTGPLASALAFGSFDPPSLIWPQDRSWFIGAPIYTQEIAIAGTQAVVDAALASTVLQARSATREDLLVIDD